MKSTILAAASLLALSCGAALAQAPGGGLLAADANKDGVITKAEFDTQRTVRFAELDKNKDGFLSEEERAAGRQGGPPPGVQAGGPPPGGGRGNIDANSDGKISKTEYIADNGLFQRVDANKDGKIDAAERAAIPARGGGRGPGG